LFATLEGLSEVSILAIGDLMLDVYTFGHANRVSPEAPVLVLKGKKREYLPGGVGNAALNLRALGANVTLIGRIGKDYEGELLLDLLEEAEIDAKSLVVQGDYPTIVKHRVIASHQQLLRIDTEEIMELEKKLEEHLLTKLSSMMREFDAVAISDYGKGFLTDSLLKGITDLAKENSIPVIVDPKGQDFEKYSGCTLVKPNEKEAIAAAYLPEDANIDEIGKEVHKRSGAEYLLITRSEKGMSLFGDGVRQDYPVKAQSVVDVTGAGDTVLALITLGFANGLDLSETIKLANVAASIAIEGIGCQAITLPMLAERLLKHSTESKVYEEDHLYALKQVIQDETFALLVIDENLPLSAELLMQMKKLRQENGMLIVYLMCESEAVTALLSTLTEIDYIILKRTATDTLIDELKPTQMYRLDHGQIVPSAAPSLR